MRVLIIMGTIVGMLLVALCLGKHNYEKDIISTAKGDLEITFFGHATFMMAWNDLIIHVDPVSQEADYAAQPKADIILVTHEHGDHLDTAAIKKIRTPDTEIIYTEACSEKLAGGKIMVNGDSLTVKGILIEAVPAYNIQHKRPNGGPFHPKGRGNGYVLDLAGTRVYIAGDTENIPEMADLNNIDIAFLPMNLPYTMTPEMAAAAARMFHPKILYPYHYGNTDPRKLVDLLKDASIEVRVRQMQ